MINNVVRYKISLQNSATFLYNNEHIEKEIRETTLFTIALVKIKLHRN